MLILDIEGSGVDYNKHSIVSIGGVDFENPENQFYAECKIWEAADVRGTSAGLAEAVCEQCGAKCPASGRPQLRAHVMEEALEVNGFTHEEIIDPNKKTEAEITIEFLEWSQHMSDRTLSGAECFLRQRFLTRSSSSCGTLMGLGISHH